jgi:hypothetical protein
MLNKRFLWYFVIHLNSSSTPCTPYRRMFGMLYSVGSPLPEYRAKASIEAADADNQIRDDEYARRYGFHAGLVPGISVFAYMSRPLVDLMERDWLQHGSAEVRFVRPIYDGEEIRVTGSVSSLSKDGTVCIDYQAANNQGVPCGIGRAQLPAHAPEPEPSLENYPAGKSRLRRPISLESLQPGEFLTPLTSEFTWNVHWQYCRKSIRDYHALYEKALHPGWILGRASRILASNYAIPAWIDVSCEVQNYRLQEEECLVETRGRVHDKYERGGDHFIVLDLAVFARNHCLQTIRYTAIFHIALSAA